jgi:hypothetical protein
MFRRAVNLVLLAISLWGAALFGATQRLYLKDGGYQLTNNYQVLADRVRYYSTERGEWEEIPLELVDLDRTKKEVAEQQAIVQQETKVVNEENAAILAERAEIEKIPAEPGAYFVRDGKIETIKLAEAKINNSTKRTVLRVLAPVPLAGKATVELDGISSPNKVDGREQEFYLRLSDDESFGIAKLTVHKDARVVEYLSVLTVQRDKIVDEKVEIVPTFKKQAADLLYKIWPEKPLEPGEYALIQYTEGKMHPKLWDFSVK